MNPIQSTTTPYGLPWGNMPKNARKSARELDNVAMNSQTMFLWQMRLYELAMSVFEWENLPEGINERQIEWWLLRDGFCMTRISRSTRSSAARKATRSCSACWRETSTSTRSR